VKCRDFHEQISAAVDHCLQSGEMSSFVEHANRCPACRCEYEMELTTKLVVRNRARMVKTPPTVAEAILACLRDEGESTAFSLMKSWKDLLRSPLVKPAIAVAATFVLVIFLIRQSSGPASSVTAASFAGNDVILQSLTNFRAVVSGDIKPQILSGVPENVRNYFAGKTEFPVLVPSMKNCTLVGGGLNKFSGTAMAHVVYSHEGQVVYMCQACFEAVMKGDNLNLPERAKNELQRTGWFSETSPGGDTIVLWKKGSTLCAAVARMNKAELLACLTEDEPREPSSW